MASAVPQPLEDALPWAILLTGSGSSSDQGLLVLHAHVRDDANIFVRMLVFALSGETTDERFTILDEDTILHAAQRGEDAAQELHEPSSAVVASLRDVDLLDSSPLSRNHSVVALILECLVAPVCPRGASVGFAGR
jgi:hypothetical protein